VARPRQRPLGVEPQVGGHLVVAAAAGVELAAGGAASSVTRRSTAVWMSSSAGPNANVPASSSSAHLVQGTEDRTGLVVIEQAAPDQASDVRARAGDVVARSRWS
jgi:hypothetical protein